MNKDTKFALQLAGIWDITPDFAEEFEKRYGVPYSQK